MISTQSFQTILAAAIDLVNQAVAAGAVSTAVKSLVRELLRVVAFSKLKQTSAAWLALGVLEFAAAAFTVQSDGRLKPGGQRFESTPPKTAPTMEFVKSMTVPELVRQYEKSVRSILTLEAEVRIVTERTLAQSLRGLKRDDSGRVIVYKAKRLWNARTSEERLERVLLQINRDVTLYAPLVAAADGKRYQGYNLDPKSFGQLGGLIESDTGKVCGDYYWIPDLLGYHFAAGPDRPLWEILKGAHVIKPEGTPPHLVVLEATYKLLGANETRLHAWIDTRHGYLPSRVEAVRLWSDTLSERLEVAEFHEASPGVWVPIRGRFTGTSSTLSFRRA